MKFQKSLLEAQLEASLDGILVVSHEGKILSFNRRFIEIWEIPDEVVASKSDDAALNSVVGKLVSPSEFLDRVKYLYAHPKETSFEEINLIDGRTLERYSAPIIGRDGTMYGRIWFFRDVTERKISEGQIAEQQKMMIYSSKMSALGAMAGGIAHEINNPLAIIKSGASLILDALQSEKPDKEVLINAATRLDHTVDRIAKIVQGLRFFCREGSNDPFQSVNLKTLIDDTVALCTERFKGLGIKLDIKVDPAITIKARPTEISQVLLNLLNNSRDAVEALPEKWVKITAEEGQHSITIRVTDSGPGIPADFRERLFTPFTTTKEVGKGMGLGLSISSGIVASHRGSLEINDSSPNTEFVVMLPK